jgi:hypothetical protein
MVRVDGLEDGVAEEAINAKNVGDQGEACEDVNVRRALLNADELD